MGRDEMWMHGVLGRGELTTDVSGSAHPSGHGVASWSEEIVPGRTTWKSFACKGFRDLIIRTNASKR